VRGASHPVVTIGLAIRFERYRSGFFFFPAMVMEVTASKGAIFVSFAAG